MTSYSVSVISPLSFTLFLNIYLKLSKIFICNYNSKNLTNQVLFWLRRVLSSYFHSLLILRSKLLRNNYLPKFPFDILFLNPIVNGLYLV